MKEKIDRGIREKERDRQGEREEEEEERERENGRQTRTRRLRRRVCNSTHTPARRLVCGPFPLLRALQKEPPGSCSSALACAASTKRAAARTLRTF